MSDESRFGRMDEVNSMSDKERFGISDQLDCSDCVNHGGDWDCDHVHCRKGTDTISRAGAIETVRKAKDKSEAHRMIIQLPSAQPETAKRIVGKSRDGMTLWYQCDMCNEPVDVQDNYCRGCGRRLTDG